MARPKGSFKKVDAQMLEKLASFGLSSAEMASILECSKDTLERRFMHVMEAGRQKRNASLKRKQFEVAMKGNPTMLIWLGKQHLDQRDKHEPADNSGNQLAELMRAIRDSAPKG